jgi:hypothetical protein
MASVQVRFCIASWEKDFLQSNLLQRGGNTPEELLCEVSFFPCKVAPAESATK